MSLHSAHTVRQQAALDLFGRLERGVTAPAWISDGVIAQWALPHDAIVKLITVSENATFLVTADGIDVGVVRLHRPGYLSDAVQITAELRWVEAIAQQTEVAVPRPVSGATGDLVHTLVDPDGTVWTAVMFEFVTGDVLESVTDPLPFASTIGRTTALLHEHARTWTPPAGFSRFEWDLPDLLGVSARWGTWEAAPLPTGTLAVLKRAEEKALRIVDRLERTPERWGLIHADLRPSNIMIDGDDLVVIDFDDAGYGWYLYDFAAALSFGEHLPTARQNAGDWVAGYRSVLPFTEEDAELACAFSMIRRLTMLGWTTTHRIDALPPELQDRDGAGSLAVAERFLASTTWLLE